MKSIRLLVFALTATALFASCKENNNDVVSGPVGSNRDTVKTGLTSVGMSECKRSAYIENMDYGSPRGGVFTFDYDGESRTLSVVGTDMISNCGTESIIPDIKIIGSLILIKHTAFIPKPMKCECVFDVNYTFQISPGIYTVKIDDLPETRLNLTAK